MNNIYYLLSEYLREQKYVFPPGRLGTRVFSDPGNNLLAISNTLDFFDIKHIVATVPKTALAELPDCFIAILSHGNHTSLALVRIKVDRVDLTLNSGKEFSMSRLDFLNDWTGVVVVIEKNKASWHIRNKALIFNISSFALIASLAIIHIALSTQSLLITIYFALSLAGLVASLMIFIKKNQDHTSFDTFCNISENTDCDTVLNSEASKVFKAVDLSDLSIIYFTFLSLSFLIDPASQLFFGLSFISLAIVPYSLYSQYVVVKKWCPLCLIVASVLVSLFVIQFHLNAGLLGIQISESLIPASFFLLASAIGWYKVKDLLTARKNLTQLETKNLAFRRNHDMFLAYHQSLPSLPKGLDKIEKIIFGSHKAAIVITAITNPLCKACLQTYEVHNRLLEHYKGKVRIDYLFLMPFQDKNDPKILISERLLELYFESAKPVFEEAWQDWHQMANTEKWLRKWARCSSDDYASMLRGQISWCIRNNISSTPTTVLNGKIFPASYRPEDLEHLVGAVIKAENDGCVLEKEIMHDKTEALNVLK
jgi:uncharacterized membrane protein